MDKGNSLLVYDLNRELNEFNILGQDTDAKVSLQDKICSYQEYDLVKYPAVTLWQH